MTSAEPQDLNSSLSSLAMLSVQIKVGKDYLDYLYGFVIEALKRMEGQSFDAGLMERTIEQEFGLKIPAATYAIYLKRLVKEGVVKVVAGGTLFQTDKVPALTVSHDREIARARIKEVTDELAGFAHTRFSLSWDERTSSAALAEFLRRYSIDFMRFTESRSPLPKAALDKATASYVVAAFVTSCATDHPGLFESIKVLVQSHILSNALLCPDLRETTRGFNSVNFVVDTRFMLKVLDLESEYDTDNTRKLLAAIRKLKGATCIFPETKDELRSVLRAISRGMQQGAGRGPVCRELAKRRRGAADVILVESNLEEKLASLLISTLPSPRYEDSNFRFQIDEKELRDEIEGEVEYINERAVEHDIRVVRHIFALRKGRHVSSIEDAGYVFLTTNSALSRAAFHYERHNSPGWIFSAVVTDYHLSHLVWLKAPMEAADLPRAEILANCYAAMKPHESFWHRYLEEIDHLRSEKKVTERDHEVLRFSLKAPEELMEVTRGQAEGINERNIHTILEKLEKDYAVEKEQRLDLMRQEQETIKQALSQAEAAAQEKTSALNSAASREEALKKEKSEQEQRLRQLEEFETLTRQRESGRRARIQRIADIAAKGAFIVAWIVFAIFGVLSWFSNWNAWYAVPAGIFGIFNIAAGFSGHTVRKFVRDAVERNLSKFID